MASPSIRLSQTTRTQLAGHGNTQRFEAGPLSQGNTKILLVTDNNPQSQLFINVIHDQLESVVTALSPDDIIAAKERTPAVVLLDTDHVNDDAIQQWHSLAQDESGLPSSTVRNVNH